LLQNSLRISAGSCREIIANPGLDLDAQQGESAMKISTMSVAAATLAFAGLSGGAQAQSLDDLSYLQGTSWYATSIDQEASRGQSATPYRILQLGAGACAFRLQLDHIDPNSGVPVLAPEVVGGYVAQITAPGCNNHNVAPDFPDGRALIAFHPGWNELAIGLGFAAPNDSQDGRTAAFGLSADRREIRFVADDLEFGHGYDRHRIRIRFNRINQPSRARAFVEGQSGGVWEALATIDLSPYRDGDIWGTPVTPVGGPDGSGHQGFILRGPAGR
jgi:hypothetical protein